MTSQGAHDAPAAGEVAENPVPALILLNEVEARARQVAQTGDIPKARQSTVRESRKEPSQLHGSPLWRFTVMTERSRHIEAAIHFLESFRGHQSAKPQEESQVADIVEPCGTGDKAIHYGSGIERIP
jgi:hypothetical protein